jgi:hypothetical protein
MNKPFIFVFSYPVLASWIGKYNNKKEVPEQTGTSKSILYSV